MKLIGHRGAHSGKILPNSIEALKLCLTRGYGLETDFRDFDERLVISHDIPNVDAPSAEAFFSHAQTFSSCTLALNVKADGIAELLDEQLERYGITNYFAFDMSVPQMLTYRDKNIRFFTRRSEYEQTPVLYEDAAGVWIDAFEDEQWIKKELLTGYLADGKDICIVSPELHGRANESFWERIASFGLGNEGIMLCTDLLTEAEEFFGGGK